MDKTLGSLSKKTRKSIFGKPNTNYLFLQGPNLDNILLFYSISLDTVPTTMYIHYCLYILYINQFYNTLLISTLRHYRIMIPNGSYKKLIPLRKK